MKLSPYLDSFTDELQKIAMAGALVGGYLGSAVPGGLGTKAVGAGVGALVGHGTQAATHQAKRVFWDEQQERERRAMEYQAQPTG